MVQNTITHNDIRRTVEKLKGMYPTAEYIAEGNRAYVRYLKRYQPNSYKIDLESEIIKTLLQGKPLD